MEKIKLYAALREADSGRALPDGLYLEYEAEESHVLAQLRLASALIETLGYYLEFSSVPPAKDVKFYSLM